MKTIFTSLFVSVFAFAGMIPEAEARRLGGGSSFGMQRQMAPAPAPRAPAAAPPRQQAAPASAQPQGRSWLGPVAGLAAGLGLAALFSHLGLGEELGSFLLIALLVFGAFMLFRMLSRRVAAGQGRPAMQYAGHAPSAGHESYRQPAGSAHAFTSDDTASTAPQAAALPADFDAAAFERQAKVQFIRLQAANDEGNLDDLREFTTPEVFAEMRMQIADRGPQEQRTDVVDLGAQVLEVAEEDSRYIVSVRFNGLIREEADAAPAPFDEVWHLTKSKRDDRGWVIAGIQQFS